MTAKIHAILGTLGLILTIWTADFRYLWTGLILLLIAIGVAANRDAKRKEQTDRSKGGKLPTALEYINNTTGKTERIYSGYHGIDNNNPGICKCGIPLTEH